MMLTRSNDNARKAATTFVCVCCAVVSALAVAPSADAGQGTAGVNINAVLSFDVHWKGYAVSMNRSWTYSWHIELTPNSRSSAVVEEHSKEGFSGTTSTSTPSYRTFVDPRIWPVDYPCAEFTLHHGTTNASPVVSSWKDCTNHPA